MRSTCFDLARCVFRYITRVVSGKPAISALRNTVHDRHFGGFLYSRSLAYGNTRTREITQML